MFRAVLVRFGFIAIAPRSFSFRGQIKEKRDSVELVRADLNENLIYIILNI